MKMSPPAGVPSRVELGSRWWHQVRLPEHCEEADGETHPKGKTKGPQAGGDGVEVMEQWREDGKMSQGWRSHDVVSCMEHA